MVISCSEITEFTRSPIETTPSTTSSSTTGRCRIRLSVMIRMHSPTECCRVTEITGLLMISDTCVSFDDLPCRITFRA